VEDLDSLCGNVHGRAVAALGVGQAPGHVIRIDIRESDDACEHRFSSRSLGEANLHRYGQL
jgi:hypothetical protein